MSQRCFRGWWRSTINPTGLAGAWEDKALNVARYVHNLEAEAEAIIEARDHMERRPKTARAQAKRLKSYLKGELQRTGIMPKALDLALRLHSNPPSVVINDLAPEFEAAAERVLAKHQELYRRLA